MELNLGIQGSALTHQLNSLGCLCWMPNSIPYSSILLVYTVPSQGASGGLSGSGPLAWKGWKAFQLLELGTSEKWTSRWELCLNSTSVSLSLLYLCLSFVFQINSTSCDREEHRRVQIVNTGSQMKISYKTLRKLETPRGVWVTPVSAFHCEAAWSGQQGQAALPRICMGRHQLC